MTRVWRLPACTLPKFKSASRIGLASAKTVAFTVTAWLPSEISEKPLVPAPSEASAKLTVPVRFPACAVLMPMVALALSPAAMRPPGTAPAVALPDGDAPVRRSPSLKPSAAAALEMVTTPLAVEPCRTLPSSSGAGATVACASRNTAPERATLSPPSAKFARPEVPVPLEVRA